MARLLSQPIAILFLLAVAMLLPGVSRGQVYGARRQQAEVPREPLQASGTVKAMQRGIIQMVTDAGDQWLLKVEPARPQDISFTGAADASFIKPGMWVRFQTKLTRRGDAADPLDRLEVFTPREGYGPGIVSDDAVRSDGAAELFGEEPQPNAKPKKAKPKSDEITVYTVAGQVSKVSRLGELTVNAAGASVKAKIADEAKVSLDLTDLTFLQVGDKIEIRGWYPAGQKGRAVATQVTGSTSQPLTDPSKKKKPAAADEKPAGAAEKETDQPAESEKTSE